MKTYRFEALGDPGSLRGHDEDKPQPQRGEVLLRIHAVSLNFRDLALAEGKLLKPVYPRLVPTSDAAAEVIAIGEDVTDFAVGDRILNSFHPRWFGGPRLQSRFTGSYGYDQDGWLMEYKVVPQDAVLKLPESLTFEEGAAIPCAAVTAWSALSGEHPIRAGQSVLTMGTGGVSLFAVQFAKALGARVISTTSSAKKAEWLRDLGADEVIDYSQVVNWGEKTRELTDGQGVDRVVEVGGPATIGQSLKAVGFDKEIVLIGFLSQDNPGIDFFELLGSGANIRSTNVGDREALREVVTLMAQKKIKPILDKVFNFDRAVEAFAHLSDAKHIGKVVITI